MEPHSLSIENQLDLFYRRGVALTKEDQHLEKLKHISYYRLKDFAAPYSTITMYGEVPVLKYHNISFDDIVKRYYQDKNLRINLLHAIEKIEVSIKRNLSYVLGENYGAFGYLDFSKWVNKNKFSKFKIEEKQYKFKKSLKKTLERSTLISLRDRKNLDKDGFPSVWIATEVLMFGNLVYLIELLSPKRQKQLALFYDCSAKELVSWLKCLNFVRNVCAHNSNIIDIQLQTKPLIRESWKNQYLYQTYDSSGNMISSNRLAVIILITIALVRNVNEKYDWSKIRGNLFGICRGREEETTRNANLMGFANANNAFDFRSFAQSNL